jgi:hypothetical protein
MRAFAPSFSFRALFGMVVALGVMLAPAIGRGEALAAVPNHDVQMMEAGHCHSPASRPASHHQGDMSCCTAMWVAVTVPYDRPADSAAVRAAPASTPLVALHRPFLGELSTPPPRSV